MKSNEERINKLLNLIITKKEKLTGLQIISISFAQCLYSARRLNALQVTSKLTVIALELGFEIADIVKELE